MVVIKGKEWNWVPSRSAVLRGAMVVATLLLTAGLGRAILVFPFDPEPSAIRVFAGVCAAVGFFAGAYLLMMAGRFARRVAGAHVMALSSAVVFVALAGDTAAWVAAGIGWGVAAAMSAWGIFLGRGGFVDATGRERRG